MTFDKLDMRLCNSILGVHRRTANAAVRGDLGRFPMTLFIFYIYILCCSVCFWSVSRADVTIDNYAIYLA